MDMLDKALEEVERAWTIWKLLIDLEQELWNRYEDQFMELLNLIEDHDCDNTSP